MMWLLFVLVLLSPETMKREPVAVPPIMPDDDGVSDHPPTAYERGDPHRWRPKRRPELGRYGGSVPTLARLMKDLRRPSAKRDAADMLMSRLSAGNDDVRGWVRQQLDDGNVAALALWVRPGFSEDDIIAAWSDAARRQAEDEEPEPTGALTP